MQTYTFFIILAYIFWLFAAVMFFVVTPKISQKRRDELDKIIFQNPYDSNKIWNQEYDFLVGISAWCVLIGIIFYGVGYLLLPSEY